MSEPTCPDCGHSDISVGLTCHTWPQGDRWMACQGCDSALMYSCMCWLRDEMPNPEDPDGMWIHKEPECKCMWDYTHGLNKYNPRYEIEEESRPSWLVGDLEFTDGFPIKHEGVRWEWDD